MKYIDEPWHIKLTEENRVDVEKWFDRGKMPLYAIIGMVKWRSKKELEKGWNTETIRDKNGHYDHGVEISYQEFKENILKQVINYEIY